ncbi:chymotrypsinogen A-like [Styela clava]
MLNYATLLLAFATLALGYPNQRIIGGENAAINTYVWQVSLQEPYGSGYWHFCGGSLISSRYVMTAAHCYNDPSVVTVYAGSTKKFSGGTRFAIESFLVFPQYNSAEISNDYGIVKLAEEAVESSSIGFVALPPADHNSNTDYSTFNGGVGTTTGWGYINYRSQNHPKNELPDDLQVANIPVYGYADCNAVWGNTYQHDNMICGGSATAGGVCMGDSGGPLVQTINGVITLIGATSWAPSTCTTQYPSGWAKLAKERQWILDNTV